MEINTQYQEKALAYIHRLSDVRFAGQVLFVIIVLLISWSGVKTIQSNYELQKQISALKQQTAVQKLENKNIALQNDYLKTNQYLELSARQNFGLANPGEKEVIVPENVALSYTVNLPTTTQKDNDSGNPPAFQRNWQAWVQFFVHRQNN